MSNEINEKNSRGVTISKRELAVIVLAVMLLIAGGIVVGLNWSNWFGKPSENTSNVKQPDLDDGAVDWQGEQSKNQSKTPDGQAGIAIPGYKTIRLKADTTQQSVNLYNPQGNDCYFVMSLLLPDGTEIWKSKMVPPGRGLYTITLNQTVAAGTYENSVLKYECYKQNDELTQLNGSEVKLILEVQ